MPSVPRDQEPPLLSEEALLEELKSMDKQGKFIEAFLQWNSRHPSMDPSRLSKLLSCLAHYMKQDTNGDQKPDWTAVIDGRFSTLLFPFDEDIDGDGIENVLDPDPFDAKVQGSLSHNGIPPHLRMLDSRGPLQLSLFKEFGIIAVDQSDRHTKSVLQTLLDLLRYGLPHGLVRHLPRLKYIYASDLHDAEVNVAAYHYQIKTLTIGGEESYGDEPLSRSMRQELLGTLAHEIGHAVLLQLFTAEELKRVATRHGGWVQDFSPETRAIETLFDSFFFSPHPLMQDSRTDSVEKPSLLPAGFPSQYALTNVHEWFAESFAAYALQELGRKGHLGSGWRKALAKESRSFGWRKLHHLNGEFRSWLKSRLLSVGRTPANQGQWSSGASDRK